MNPSQSTKVLITVMTYPHPSIRSREAVCTAGITENNEWVRLYPIAYRYCNEKQKFKKYQWIKVNLEPKGSNNDNRKESRKPDVNTIELLSNPLSTKNDWKERRRIIDKMPHHTVNELSILYEEDKTSLGIVKPETVKDLIIEDADTDWKPEWQLLYKQLPLFGGYPKPLRKIPYIFSYVFECEDDTTPHKLMITDWELGVLFLKEADRLGSDEKAAKKVKDKYLNELCRNDKDTRFFLGTTYPFNSWIVLGVFWPPKPGPESAEFDFS